MKNNLNQWMRRSVMAGLLLSTSLTFWDCSGEKKESTGDGMSSASNTDTASGSDSSVFGRQGDTLNSSSMNAPQQAPPDSASAQGAVVPAEVKVRAKK